MVAASSPGKFTSSLQRGSVRRIRRRAAGILHVGGGGGGGTKEAANTCHQLSYYVHTTYHNNTLQLLGFLELRREPAGIFLVYFKTSSLINLSMAFKQVQNARYHMQSQAE